jgi:hypothetical protein
VQQRLEQRVDATAGLQPDSDGQAPLRQASKLVGQRSPHERFAER